MKKSVIKKLKRLRPCNEAIEFAKMFESRQEAWDSCERGDWMLWLIEKKCYPPDSQSRKRLVLVACKCARLAWKKMPEKGKKAIRLAERWGKDDKNITLNDLRSAANAATSAAAYAIYGSASAAACAAAYAASAAAYDAASAAHAAASAAASAAAIGGMRTKTLKKCADIVRKYYPKPPRL